MTEISTLYINDVDSVQKSIQGKHAFLTTWDFFIPLAKESGYSDIQLCSSMSSVPVLNIYSGFYVARNSTIKESFNYG